MKREKNAAMRVRYYVKKVKKYTDYRGPRTDRRARRFVRLMEYKFAMLSMKEMVGHVLVYGPPHIEGNLQFEGQIISDPRDWHGGVTLDRRSNRDEALEVSRRAVWYGNKLLEYVKRPQCRRQRRRERLEVYHTGLMKLIRERNK